MEGFGSQTYRKKVCTLQEAILTRNKADNAEYEGKNLAENSNEGCFRKWKVHFEKISKAVYRISRYRYKLKSRLEGS